MTLAFEMPGTFSWYKLLENRVIRQVYRPVGKDPRLVRVDVLDAGFGLIETESHMDRPVPLRRLRAEAKARGAGA